MGEDHQTLPPMITSDVIAETQRLEDLKAFRKYLADTGAIRCLVKMYQHTAKHEIRLDNPKVVTDFLATYTEMEEQEMEALTRENETLREYNAMLAQQEEDLIKEIEALGAVPRES